MVGMNHTPTVPLMGGKYGTKLLGFACQHCGQIFTPSMNPSYPFGAKGPTKAHHERVQAHRRATKEKTL